MRIHKKQKCYINKNHIKIIFEEKKKINLKLIHVK